MLTEARGFGVSSLSMAQGWGLCLHRAVGEGQQGPLGRVPPPSPPAENTQRGPPSLQQDVPALLSGDLPEMQSTGHGAQGPLEVQSSILLKLSLSFNRDRKC